MVNSFQALDPKHSIIKGLHYPWICDLGGGGTDQNLSIQYGHRRNKTCLRGF